jgi:ribosomal protein S18 acetylase RimI-like enzyme
MKISIATKNQLEIVNQLAHDIWFIAYNNIISDEQIKYMLNRMYSIKSLEQQLDNKQVFLLVQEDDIFIGYASYEINSDLNHKTKIHKLYVLPQYQGKGIGNLLIDEISKTAKLNNQSALFLNVNKNNKAVHFYQKVGFATLFSTVIDIGNSYVMDDFVMEKTI